MDDLPGTTASTITLEVNGREHTLTADHRLTLLDALRNELDLTGSKRAVTRASAAPAPSWSTAGG